MKTTPCTQPNKVLRLTLAPRCLAKTRRGTLCQCPAVKDRHRCRFHGCAKGSGAPKGNKNALTHGESTAEIKAFKRDIHHLLNTSRKIFKQFNNHQNNLLS